MLKFAGKFKNHMAGWLPGAIALSIATFTSLTIAAALNIDVFLWQLWFLGLISSAAAFVLALIVLVQSLLRGHTSGSKHSNA